MLKRVLAPKTPALLFCALLCACALEPEEISDAGEPLPSLVGTRWVFALWGNQRLYFKTGDTVEYTLDYPPNPSLNETIEYHYEYDKNRKTGEIEDRGAFLISRDNQTLHIPDYYIYGHPVDFIRVPDSQPQPGKGRDTAGKNLSTPERMYDPAADP
jgi:hypothetical protein